MTTLRTEAYQSLDFHYCEDTELEGQILQLPLVGQLEVKQAAYFEPKFENRVILMMLFLLKVDYMKNKEEEKMN